MAFPVELVSTLTGATTAQLAYWRSNNPNHALLVPEVARRPRALYSFRDVVALRTVVRLRQNISLQAIRRAYGNLEWLDLTDHPSSYNIVRNGSSIAIVRDGGQATDLLMQPGHDVLANLQEIFERFDTAHGLVVDFLHPRKNLEVRERRLGGWPTVAGTRVAYDAIASLVGDGSVPFSRVEDYYPSVSVAAAHDAADFAEEVASHRPAASRVRVG